MRAAAQTDPEPDDAGLEGLAGPAPGGPTSKRWPDGHMALVSAKSMRGPDAVYHPWNFRGWWDFGTGALGDMGCHYFNTPLARSS